MKEQKSIENITFEEAISELEMIVKKIDGGEISLENSISAYEYGMKLKNHCEMKLKEAKLKIEKISIEKEGVTTDKVEL